MLQVCDQAVSGAIPRSLYGTVLVPLVNVQQNIIIGILPFYISIKKCLNAPAVCVPHYGIPRRGWEAHGSRVVRAIEAHPTLSPELMHCSRVFTATTYNGAYLACALAARGYPASLLPAKNTVDDLEYRLKLHREATACTSTVHAHASGERVFIQHSVGGEWFPGCIVQAHGDGSYAVRCVPIPACSTRAL